RDAQIVDARLRKVLGIRLQLDRRGRKLGLAIARSIEQLASLLDHAIDFSQTAANFVRLDLQQSCTRFACVALSVEIDEFGSDGEVVHLALRLFAGCSFDLREKGSNAF